MPLHPALFRAFYCAISQYLARSYLSTSYPVNNRDSPARREALLPGFDHEGGRNQAQGEALAGHDALLYPAGPVATHA